MSTINHTLIAGLALLAGCAQQAPSLKLADKEAAPASVTCPAGLPACRPAPAAWAGRTAPVPTT